MRLTTFRHSCLLVDDGDARLLVDPGSFSRGFETLTGLTGVLITHGHADHLDVERLAPLLTANPDAALLADTDSATRLREAGFAPQVAEAGATYDLGTPVTVHGAQHATIHPDLPGLANVGYLIGGRLLHPGDALTVVPDVEVLALPVAAPWLKAAETVDYLRAVHPRVAVPVHEALLAVPHVYYRLIEQLAPVQTTLRVLDPDAPDSV